ncbi:MAG TPA: HAD-IB family hydrolase [Candidatus Pacearchaeota archaeon]|nr:HAD-IB family hydrolase [Candidatus Pacearchaeota archaeon]HOU45887.1 HAD-IB family hydrolase [Candidatus Pacearchaeota archaeon]HQI74683.1 HAD-IB family hydrolase [Candidatus Pacearchaeota archaeon]
MIKKPVAVFDIDGTLFRSSLFIKLTERLIQEGIFPKTAQTDYLKSFTLWQDRQGSYEDYISQVIAVFSRNIKGVDFSEFKRISNDIVFFEKNKVYRYTRDLVKKLKKKGYYLLAISHSPKIIIDAFCKEAGFDKSYGFIYEFNNFGKLTGEAKFEELITQKEKILKRAVEKENLTLKNSYGVGDGPSDIGFLSLVDNPICFNPNKMLYNHAKRKKWKIIVERKDVIYEI